ncbi:MAG: VanZ family protein, partial [Lactobacillus crispatus]|nr:VanZ family protein [Lactobacillus crispatus]
MDKFHFTKREKIFLLLALLVLVALFISSSMTYQQQEIHDNKINRYFGWLEN